MPVYNAEKYVGEAVESILAQTFRDFEFIIVNDGSTDASLSIVQEYARRDPRIRVISRPNTGIVGALNDGLALCSRTFVARMDADDVSRPERLARQVAYLQDHSDCVAVGCRLLLTDPDGLPLFAPPVITDHDAIDRSFLAGQGGVVPHPAAVFRRAALLQVGGYRSEYEYCEDYDLFLRVAERGRLANLQDTLYENRQHASSVCATHPELQRQRHEAARREALLRRGLPVQKLVQTQERSLGSDKTELHRKWAWWALQSGYLFTARKHALRALRHSPFSLASWRVVACAIRGY